MTSLAVLAVAAAVVSYSAQYRMVYAAKGNGFAGHQVVPAAARPAAQVPGKVPAGPAAAAASSGPRAHQRRGTVAEVEQAGHVPPVAAVALVASAQGEDWAAGQAGAALSRPGGKHDHQGGRVRADQRGVRARAGGGVQPAGDRRGAVDVPVESCRRMRAGVGRDSPR